MSDERDVLKDPWVCLGCSRRVTFGELLCRDVPRCPHCRSDLLQPLGNRGETQTDGGRTVETVQ